ncbi:WS/DGAT domain-containing protein [Nocardia sp. NBC_00508]|uniref:wax ester/triacylglycerol synthase domain-containing protein n=1 Tax=Nocardia sp. NBC_00508 TaxID=2975992 RepID=UPI002E818507|nr:wax ester/triacylglycerol synthase domain-containing protein [Nocardia sp. NBC_00508]WUD64162.1 WS/DGAT domain-containing protein [Nocardia sp. NBC_00508]
MPESQLVANDASYYYFARSGRVTDWPMWWVFDSETGAPPTAADIARHVGERAELLEPLRRRIHEVPGGLGHPFWGVDDTPIDSHVVTHAADLDWTGCLDRIGSILERPLDARVSAWQLHVFPEVSGIPTLSGAGTVVLMHVSHALMAGPAMTSLSEALFAPEPAPVRIEGLGHAAKRLGLRLGLAAVGGVLRWPFQVMRFNARVGAENRRIARDNDDSGPSTPPRSETVFNRRIGPGRVMRTIPLELREVRASGITVTAVGLAAISRAMQRYLDKQGAACPDDLAAFVTIAVPDAAVMGANHTGADVVDLFPGELDLAGRARAVDATLRVRRHSASSRRELTRLELVDLLPSRVYRARYGTLPPAAPAVAHTILTSVKCEPTAEWSLLDKPFRFAGMLPPVYPDIGLAHSFVGVRDSFTVSVACDPEIVPDLDDYCDILLESFREIAAAVGDSD